MAVHYRYSNGITLTFTPGVDFVGTMSPCERLLCPTLVRHTKSIVDSRAFEMLPEHLKEAMAMDWIELLADRERGEACQFCGQTRA